jgi:hypothetical protein
VGDAWLYSDNCYDILIVSIPIQRSVTGTVREV